MTVSSSPNQQERGAKATQIEQQQANSSKSTNRSLHEQSRSAQAADAARAVGDGLKVAHARLALDLGDDLRHEGSETFACCRFGEYVGCTQ
jgi:hypothetical protein